MQTFTCRLVFIHIQWSFKILNKRLACRKSNFTKQVIMNQCEPEKNYLWSSWNFIQQNIQKIASRYTYKYILKFPLMRMIKRWTEIFSSINNLKYYYMYTYAYLKKKCQNEYGNKFLEKKFPIYVYALWIIGMSIRCYIEGWVRASECAFQAAHACTCTSVITQHIILIAPFS